MNREESWQVIAAERLSLADLLEDLSEQEWSTPSLSAGWRVRDVAAHVAMAPQPPGVATIARQTVRAGFNLHRLNHELAVAHAARPTTEIVAELRRHADSRRLPVVTNYRNITFDVLVHGQDIAIPLGRPRDMPLAAARDGADRVWTMGWPFWARRRLRGLRLRATDVDWSVGAGPEVRGPIAALLLLLTGRTAALPRLTGPGAARLRGDRDGGDRRSTQAPT